MNNNDNNIVNENSMEQQQGETEPERDNGFFSQPGMEEQRSIPIQNAPTNFVEQQNPQMNERNEGERRNLFDDAEEDEMN